MADFKEDVLPWMVPAYGIYKWATKDGDKKKKQQEEAEARMELDLAGLGERANLFETNRETDIKESRAALNKYGTNVSAYIADYQKGAESDIEKQLKSLSSLSGSFSRDAGEQKGMLQNYFNENYYRDYLQSPQAQAAIRLMQDQYKDVISSTQNSAVRGGMTPGAEIMARTQAAKGMASGVNQLSAQGETVKQSTYQNYLAGLNDLNRQKQAGQQFIQGSTANVYGQKANVAGNVLNSQSQLEGTQYAGLRDILKGSGQDDLMTQQLISNILNTKFGIWQTKEGVLSNQATAQGQTIGNIGNMAVNLLSLLMGASDIRLKKDIQKLGTIKDVNIYNFRYIYGDQTLHTGVMAQEIELILPDAVGEIEGFKYVDYGKVFEYFNN